MKPRTPKPSQPDDLTVTVGARSWDALWTTALAYQPEPIRPAGEGWKSTPDIMRETGMTKEGARYRMACLVARGRFERAMGRSPNGQRVAYYRPIPNNAPTGKTSAHSRSSPARPFPL